jgi:hypothetical protein
MIRCMALATIACVAGLSCAKTPPTAAVLKPSESPAPAVTSSTPSAPSAKAPAPKPVATASKYPVIVHVVSRDKTVTVSSSPKGLVYSAAQNDGGKVLVADASGEEFARLQPEVYRAIRGTIAVKSNDAFLWDGVETSDKKLDNEIIGVDWASTAGRE